MEDTHHATLINAHHPARIIYLVTSNNSTSSIALNYVHRSYYFGKADFVKAYTALVFFTIQTTLTLVQNCIKLCLVFPTYYSFFNSSKDGEHCCCISYT